MLYCSSSIVVLGSWECLGLVEVSWGWLGLVKVNSGWFELVEDSLGNSRCREITLLGSDKDCNGRVEAILMGLDTVESDLV